MKIQVDGNELFELEEWQKDVMKYLLLSEDFENDMKRRLKWALTHKFEQCFAQLEKDWLPLLRQDPAISSIPTDPQEFASFIFTHPDYKDRSRREAENELKKSKNS